jgi:hypothetical protein
MYARPYEERWVDKVVRKENRRRRDEKSALKKFTLSSETC